MASLTAGSTDPQHRTRPDGGWVLLGVVLYCYLLFFFNLGNIYHDDFIVLIFSISRLRYEQVPEV